jgi:hypothetical protein
MLILYARATTTCETLTSTDFQVPAWDSTHEVLDTASTTACTSDPSNKCSSIAISKKQVITRGSTGINDKTYFLPFVTAKIDCAITGIDFEKYDATKSPACELYSSVTGLDTLYSVGNDKIQSDAQNNNFAYKIALDSNAMTRTLKFCATLKFTGGKTYVFQDLELEI